MLKIEPVKDALHVAAKALATDKPAIRRSPPRAS